ncbi:hypothetical protein ACROYT_G040237 [Oculina patagonica]
MGNKITVTYAKNILFLFLILATVVFLVDGRLSSQFPVSELTEESKEKGREKDYFSRQIIHGGSHGKGTTSICGLVSQEEHFGQGIDLQTVHRNVNHCRITSVQTTEKPDQRRGMPCNVPRMCVANESLVEEIALLEGLKQVTSALSCHCLDPRPRCHRQTNIRVFHWGTTYEKTVDVGQCVGSCNKGKKTCLPIASKTVNVKGPNGAHCVEKVLKCGCARNCRRVSFHQLYSITVFDEKIGANKTVEQVIDVGRCVGECSKRKKGRCLHWVDNPLWYPGSDVPSKVCMLSSSPGETGGKCRSRSFGAQVLFAEHGAPKTVNVIKRCKCN